MKTARWTDIFQVGFADPVGFSLIRAGLPANAGIFGSLSPSRSGAAA
jgi:hypothetical protein